MAITTNDLPQSSTYALLKEKTGRKDRLKTFIDNVAKRYPTAQARITQFGTDNQTEYDGLKGISADNNFRQFFDKFNKEEDLEKLIDPEAIKEITNAIAENPADSDVLKDLKATAREKTNVENIPLYFENAKGGITGSIFLSDLISNYYLKDAAAYIDKKLTDNGVKLSELDQGEGNKARTAFYNDIYSTFDSTDQESDLDGLLKGINEETANIKDLIVKTRQKKETSKDDEIADLKKQLADAKKGGDHSEELDDLKNKLKTAEAEKKKLADDNKDLKDVAKDATKEINRLTKENDKLTKQLAAKPVTPPGPGPTPSGGGSTAAINELQQEIAEMVLREDWDITRLDALWEKFQQKYPNPDSQIEAYFDHLKKAATFMRDRNAHDFYRGLI